MSSTLPKKRTVGVAITVAPFAEQVQEMLRLARAGTGAYVCCVNAHMTVEAHNDPAFAAVVNAADMATPDGMPLLRSLNRAYGLEQERVAGNDLLPALFAAAERSGVGVFLYGGKEEVLEKIRLRAGKEYPGLRLVGAIAPPFRKLTDAEHAADLETMRRSGAGIVMVSLGCPKQERWMAANREALPALSIGLGGAFLLYAGVDTRAPKWMRDLSLEWFYRFMLEPGRLWKRYLITNTTFMRLAWKQRVRGNRTE